MPSRSGATKVEAQAAVEILAGEVFYLDANDLDEVGQGKARLADANATSGQAAAAGIADCHVHPGQMVRGVSIDSLMVMGATLVVAMQYVLSATPGKICPITDMTSGWFYTPLFIAVSTTEADVSVAPTGKQRA